MTRRKIAVLSAVIAMTLLVGQFAAAGAVSQTELSRHTRRAIQTLVDLRDAAYCKKTPDLLKQAFSSDSATLASDKAASASSTICPTSHVDSVELQIPPSAGIAVARVAMTTTLPDRSGDDLSTGYYWSAHLDRSGKRWLLQSDGQNFGPYVRYSCGPNGTDPYRVSSPSECGTP